MSNFPVYDQKPNGHGLCCIIANFHSRNNVNGPNRILQGYKHDVDTIKSFFEQTLKYTIYTKLNLTKTKFFNALDEIKDKITNDDNIDRLVVFILSHGSEEGIHTCSDASGMTYERDANGKAKTVKVETITKSFDHWNIPSLKGYPKCIFIQACRGMDFVSVAPVAESHEYESNKTPSYDILAISVDQDLQETATGEPTDICKEEKQDEAHVEENDTTIHFTLTAKQVPNPSSANMLIAFACVPNTVSFVNTCGSWFITTIMEKMKNHYEDEHIMDILSDVNNDIITIRAPTDVPVNYITDNTMSAFIKVGDEFKPFGVYAYRDNVLLGKVHYISPNHGQVEYKGVLRRKTPIPIQGDFHIICCLVKCKKLGSVQRRYMEPSTYERDVLGSDDHTVIANSCQLISRINGRTVGIGKLYHDPNTLKVTKMEHSILYLNDTGMEYYGCTELCDSNGVARVEKLDMIDGKGALVSKKSMVEGPNKCRDVQIPGKVIQQHPGSHPTIEGHVQQLCIFESTLTKKFYLSNNKVGEDVVDSKFSSDMCPGPPLPAGGDITTVDAAGETGPSFVGALWNVYTSSLF